MANPGCVPPHLHVRSSIQALEDMKVLSRIETPSSSQLSESNAAAGAHDNRGGRAYAHASCQEEGVTLLDKAPLLASPVDTLSSTAKAGDASRGHKRSESQRRDRKARSAAASAQVIMKDPPKELRMGLGWACLHVDLAVYTEEKTEVQTKRVAGHIQWCDFWSTYEVSGDYRSNLRRGGETVFLGICS